MPKCRERINANMVKPDDCVSTDFRAWFPLYHTTFHQENSSTGQLRRFTNRPAKRRKHLRGPAPSERRFGSAPARWPLPSRSPTGKIAGWGSWIRTNTGGVRVRDNFSFSAAFRQFLTSMSHLCRMEIGKRLQVCRKKSAGSLAHPTIIRSNVFKKDDRAGSR